MLNVRLKPVYKEIIFNGKGRIQLRDIVAGNRKRGLYNENYRSLVYFNLNVKHSKLMKKACLDLYLASLLECNFLDMFISVKTSDGKCVDDRVILKRITKYDVGKIISINVTSLINDFSYGIGKKTCIEIYTKSTLGYAVFKWSNSNNTPILQFLYDKLDGKEILYNMIKTEENKEESLDDKYDIAEKNLLAMKMVLSELMGEYIEVEIDDCLFEPLCGRVDTIDGDNLILFDGELFTLVNISSIMLIATDRDVEIRDINSSYEKEESIFGIKEILLAYRKQGILYMPKTRYLGKTAMDVIDATDFLAKLRERPFTDGRFFIMSISHIKVIDKINKNNLIQTDF